MASSLVDSLSGDYEPEEFEDDYAEAVTQLVATKIEGGDITETPEAKGEETEVVDLLAALQRSVDKAKARQDRRVAPASPDASDDGAATKTAAKSRGREEGDDEEGRREEDDGQEDRQEHDEEGGHEEGELTRAAGQQPALATLVTSDGIRPLPGTRCARMKGCGRRRSTSSAQRLRTLPENPRVVVSGNMAVPWEAVRALDAAQPTYVLHALNAPARAARPRGRDRRDVLRRSGYASAPAPALRAVPSLARPAALRRAPSPPDAVLLHCAPPRHGQVSMGLEVNVLPAALEACRARGGLVVAVVNPQMPYTFGDAQVPLEHVDLMVEVDSPHAVARRRRSPTPRAGSSASASRPWSRTARRCSSASAPCPTPPSPASTVAPRPADVDRDVLRRRARPRRRRARSTRDHPLVTSFSFGSTRALRLARRQPAGADDAHREDERPRPHRPAAADDVGQHRARGRPLRPGQRLAHQRPHPLRVRRTDRLHRRGAALRRAASRSSRCARGTPRPTCRRSCRCSTSRSRASSRAPSSPSTASPQLWGSQRAGPVPRHHRASAPTRGARRPVGGGAAPSASPDRPRASLSLPEPPRGRMPSGPVHVGRRLVGWRHEPDAPAPHPLEPTTDGRWRSSPEGREASGSPSRGTSRRRTTSSSVVAAPTRWPTSWRRCRRPRGSWPTSPTARPAGRSRPPSTASCRAWPGSTCSSTPPASCATAPSPSRRCRTGPTR